MQKNWRQKAKIRLLIDEQDIEDWSEKEIQLRQFILREFHLDQDDPTVTFSVSGRERISVEFTATCYDATVSALSIVETLEKEFFGLRIYKREISFIES